MTPAAGVKLRVALLFCLAATAQAQEPVSPRPVELPEAPVALAHSNIFGGDPPTRLLVFVGAGLNNKGIYRPVYSANYWLTNTYGLYFSRSTVAYSFGLALSLGHKKDHR